jgi:hypothetical protein
VKPLIHAKKSFFYAISSSPMLLNYANTPHCSPMLRISRISIHQRQRLTLSNLTVYWLILKSNFHVIYSRESCNSSIINRDDEKDTPRLTYLSTEINYRKRFEALCKEVNKSVPKSNYANNSYYKMYAILNRKIPEIPKIPKI